MPSESFVAGRTWRAARRRSEMRVGTERAALLTVVYPGDPRPSHMMGIFELRDSKVAKEPSSAALRSTRRPGAPNGSSACDDRVASR